MGAIKTLGNFHDHVYLTYYVFQYLKYLFKFKPMYNFTKFK